MIKGRLPKVAIVHPSVSWYRLPLFQQLARMYPNMVVLFTKSNILPVYASESIRVNKPKGFKSKVYDSYRLLPPPYPQQVTPSIITELVKGGNDVVIWGDSLTSIEALSAFLICKILRKPLVLWLDEWGMPRPFLRRLVDPIIKFIILHSSAIITHGKKHKEYFRLLGLEEDRLFVTGSVSWIVPTKRDNEIANTLSERSKGKKIVYIGRLIERKGVKYLVETFAKLVKENGDLELWIIGCGREKRTLINLTRELKIEEKVTFFGGIPHSKIAPYFLVADVFVLPSWNEPWGLVINEAMSLGKPIITTYGVGSCSDLVEDGVNGFIVPPKNPDALYKAIKNVISSGSALKSMGKKSLEIIKNYTYEKMSLGFLEAILHVLELEKSQ